MTSIHVRRTARDAVVGRLEPWQLKLALGVNDPMAFAKLPGRAGLAATKRVFRVVGNEVTEIVPGQDNARWP